MYRMHEGLFYNFISNTDKHYLHNNITERFTVINQTHLFAQTHLQNT